MSAAVTDMLGENQYVAKVIPIRVKKDARGVSRALPEDPFINMYNEGGIIEPPYDLFTLAVMPEVSSELGPAIDAMVVNIAKMGHRIVPRDSNQRREEIPESNIRMEIAKVKNFFSNAILEATQSFTTFRATLRNDLEATGNSYYEILRNVINDEPAGLTHLPSWQMRLRKEDEEMTDHEVLRAVQSSDGSWSIQAFPYSKRFRRYVQIRDSEATKVYFKEWGDPRPISKHTGEVITDEQLRSAEFSEDMLATEVVHLRLYSSRGPYGLPRWIGNLFTVFGNRAAEVINYTTFRSNNIPAMMLMATNVQLTEASIERIQKFVEERIQGDDNYSTILLIEGEPITEGMRDPGTMKLDIKELTHVQHTDALFVNYMERNDDKIRRSFRLPPIFMGRAEDYTRATADSSRKVGEEQVFRPARNEDDDVWNQTIVPALGTPNVLFRSNTPDITDNYELTQLLAVAEQSGGLSPEISRLITEDILGRELPPIADDIRGDIPFSLTMLHEQTKADIATAGITESDAIVQLEKLKMMMDDSDSMPDEAYNAVNILIKLLSLQKKSTPKIKVHHEHKDKKEKTIRQVDGEYCVYSEDGNTNFGCYDTVDEAKDRLAQIETFSEKTADVTIDKVFKAETETEQHIVGGAVLVPGVVDLQGDIYDDQSTEDAAHYWLEHYMEDPKENGIKFMHQGEVIYDAARPIQSWVLDREMEFEVEVPAASDGHPSKELTTLTYPKGTWILYARIRDSSLWDMFKNGELTGWSIGGVAAVQQLKCLSTERG